MATLEQSEMDQAGAKVTPNLFCFLQGKYRLVLGNFFNVYISAKQKNLFFFYQKFYGTLQSASLN